MNIYRSYEHEHGNVIPDAFLRMVEDARFSPPEVDDGYLERCEADEKRINELGK